jgi:hypothetical protein
MENESPVRLKFKYQMGRKDMKRYIGHGCRVVSTDFEGKGEVGCRPAVLTGYC